MRVMRIFIEKCAMWWFKEAIMTEKEVRKLVAAIKTYSAKHASTPEKARALLKKEGVINAKGKLAKPYSRKLAKAS